MGISTPQPPIKPQRPASKAGRRKKMRVRIQGISLLVLLASPIPLYRALQANNFLLAGVCFVLISSAMLAVILAG
jgi:hypothetical protein